MRFVLIILALNSCPAFASEGRLIQILNQVTQRFCAVIVEGNRESTAKYGFHKVTRNTVITPVDIEDQNVVSRAQAIGTDPQVMEMSGDYLNAGLIHRLFTVGVRSLEELTYIDRGILNLVVRLHDGETIIGLAQIAKTDFAAPLMRGISKDRSKWFEISFHFDPAYWGKGYATEVAEALVHVAMINGAEGVYAQALTRNEASRKVLTNAGFRVFDRVQPTSFNEREGTSHYVITREAWKRRPAPVNNVIRVSYGQGLAVLRVRGQIPTWTVVEIDHQSLQSRRGPQAISGQDRLLQLSTKSDGQEPVGIFVSVPVQWFAIIYFSSTFEIEQLFSASVVGGTFDRSLFRLAIEERITHRLRNELGYDPSQFFPEDFLRLTIFEKRRIYEKLKGIVVLDEKGRNAVTRQQVVPEWASR